MSKISTDIAIIGGGVIGLTTALRLRAHARKVLVIDPNEPGSGASYGNAGTIADYAIIPVDTPSVLRNFLFLLLDEDSPLAIRKAALPTLFPWLARFAYESLPHRYRDNARRLADLLSDASSAWTDLAAEIGASSLLTAKGCLYIYQTSMAFRAAASDIELRRSYGVSQEFISANDALRLEPSLPPFEGGALFFPKAINFADPGEVMRLLYAAVRQAGVDFVKAAATCIAREHGGIRVAASPFEVLEFDMADTPIARPVCPAAQGFYLCPMRGRLRVAGMVELGGLAAPANPRLLQALAANARRIFPELGAPSRTWLGFRPSMPDSVPVIRPSKGGRDVIFAFGHGHIGLTLAPHTARLVSAMLA